MKYQCSGVILAGGESKRFGGKNKAFIKIHGENILDHICGIYKELFEEIILVTNDPLRYLPEDIHIVTDLFSIRSSLTGIHAGLFYCTAPYAFFSACDTPFLKKEVVQTILNHMDYRSDIIIPETTKGLEPLCAVYSKKCLPTAEQYLTEKKLKIIRVFQRHRIKKIPETVLRQKDPDLISFFNINTPRELERAARLSEVRIN